MTDIERSINELVNLGFTQNGGRGLTRSMVMREKAEQTAKPDIPGKRNRTRISRIERIGTDREKAIGHG